MLVNFAEYERLKETLDVLSDPDLMRQIQRAENFMPKVEKGSPLKAYLGNPS